MSESVIEKIPEKLQREFDKYFHLRIGGKKVPCPYFINSKTSSGSLRVMAGKGEAEEIELETVIWAKVKGFNLRKATTEEIRKFMLKLHIGIDCSGLVANALEKYLVATKKKPLINYLKFEDNSLLARLRRFLRPIENIGANTLTSKLNCKVIKSINDIQPGDLIRSKGKITNAHHLAMITEVEKYNDQVKKFRYVNSISDYEEENGVRYGEVIITDPSKGLKEQHWTDTLNGRNYFYEGLLVNYEDNGIRRFKNIKI